MNSAISGQNRTLVPVPNGVVPVPLMQRQIGTGTIQSGTSTTLQNRFGTGTKHSGTGTTSSGNPGFWYLCIVKL